jgi:transcriptional regulator with XRE-family HTH domain
VSVTAHVSRADRRVGVTIKAIRMRMRLRQSDAAAAAGISQSAWSRVELGHIDEVTVGTLRRMLEALDGRLEVRPWWHGAALDRLMDERHAQLTATVLATLQAHAWTVWTEVSYSEWGERGSIDILAWHPPTRTLLVIEIKSELGSTEDLIRRLDAKVRLAPGIASKRFGLKPGGLWRLVVMADERSNRRAVARHEAVFSTAFPTRGWDVRRWIAEPVGDFSGLWFLTLTSRAGVTRNPSAVRRFRKVGASQIHA